MYLIWTKLRLLGLIQYTDGGVFYTEGLMLDHSLWRWPNIKSALGQRLVYTEQVLSVMESESWNGISKKGGQWM